MADAGFYVIMEEVSELQEKVIEQTTEWMEQIAVTAQTVEEYVAMLDSSASGALAEAIRDYLAEVHTYALENLYMIQTELSTRMLEYGEGLFEIEPNRAGYIRQEVLQEQEESLMQERDKFLNCLSEAEGALGGVSDIVGGLPSTEGVEAGYQEQINQLLKLEETIVTYEDSHKTDLDMLSEMINSLTSFIRRYQMSPQIGLGNYERCSALKHPETEKLKELGASQKSSLGQKAEKLERMQEQRITRLQAEEREKEGKAKLIKGIIIVTGAVISIGVIVYSGGTAAPVVTSFWGKGLLVSNSVSICYGAAEAVEGSNMVQLGREGDILTLAKNPIRDTIPLFQENPDLYYLIGEGSVLLSSVGMEGYGYYQAATKGFGALARYGGEMLVSEAGEGFATDYMVTKLGMSEEEATLLAMGLGTPLYEGSNLACRKIGGISVYGKYRERLEFAGSTKKVEMLSGSGRYSGLSDLMLPEEVERYLDFLENGSQAGLSKAELRGIAKVDEFLELQKINYQEIIDIRNSGNIMDVGYGRGIESGTSSSKGGSGGRLIPGSEGIVTGGDSTKLGKNMMESMGLPRGTNWTGHQAQHIIPAEMANHPVLQRIGMDLDDASNGLFLRTPADDISAMSRHRGYHSTYNEFVRTQLDGIDINQSIDVLQKQVYDLQQNLKYLQQSGLPLYPSQGATVDLWQRSLERIQ